MISLVQTRFAQTGARITWINAQHGGTTRTLPVSPPKPRPDQPPRPETSSASRVLRIPGWPLIRTDATDESISERRIELRKLTLRPTKRFRTN